jgi:hypothetical protein
VVRAQQLLAVGVDLAHVNEGGEERLADVVALCGGGGQQP